MTSRTFKVLILGSTNTGKTSIIRRYTQGDFTENHFVTPLPIATSQTLSYKDIRYELQIWDTAGAEDWASMNANVYHDSNAVIFVAAVDNQASVSEIFNVWQPRLGEYMKPDEYLSFVCINKADLENPLVDRDEIEDVKSSLNAVRHFVVTAKNDNDVKSGTVFNIFDDGNNDNNDIHSYVASEISKMFEEVGEALVKKDI
ncbi:ras-related protein Rab-31-like protein [Tritrichomonas foetus]|uniref:Ras-related protein Rab-31-like protein n=1 Tax=Tritrichomonas foetus TaxID=1144522 RepID=A0A1J4KNA4_9EUKA|nr:ras-related protein Rab-31-like protein [Tritrichomonas foetus]|eukprot:OHT12384.1 ras-related protein Rab-31-like protein [Tritrichomonas foetus]